MPIPNSELKVEILRDPRPNDWDRSKIKVTHIPTGVEVTVGIHRSPAKNKQAAVSGILEIITQ